MKKLICVIAILCTSGALYSSQYRSYFQLKENEVYHLTECDDVKCPLELLEGADAGTFEVLSFTYGKDENGIYYMDKRVEKANVASFEVLSYLTAEGVAESDYAKDKYNVYYKGKIIKGASPVNFKATGNTTGENDMYRYEAGALLFRK